VGEDVPVEADECRQEDAPVLRDPVGDVMEVGRLLVVLGIELEPPRVPEGDRVLLVVPDRERGTEGPVDDGHDDREAQPRGVEAHLEHQRQALRRRRRIDA